MNKGKKRITRKQRIGYWIFDDPIKADFMCSECGERNDLCVRICPSCKAKMDVEHGCREERW